MDYESPRRRSSPPEDSPDRWDVEPWDAKLDVVPAPLPVPRIDVQRVRPAVRPPVTVGRDRSILGIFVTQASFGAVALICSFLPWLSRASGWPWGFFVAAIFLLAGIALSQDGGFTLFTRGWIANLIAVVAIAPLTAIAVGVARQPHVSLSAGSAWAPILLAMTLTVFLVGAGIGFGIWSNDEPDEAGLLVLPLALVVPAIIGIRGEIDQGSALQAVAMAAGIAAIASLMCWSVAASLRAFAPPLALGLLVVLLWLTGNGPSFTSTSGQVVPLLFSMMFAMTVLVVVGTSIVAIAAREVERESRPFSRVDVGPANTDRATAPTPLR